MIDILSRKYIMNIQSSRHNAVARQAAGALKIAGWRLKAQRRKLKWQKCRLEAQKVVSELSAPQSSTEGKHLLLICHNESE